MRVSVFGNPEVKEDSLVVEMVDQLREKFPKIEFKVEDPTEGLEPPKDGLWVILDVAKGVNKVKVFSDLDKLVVDKRVSLHDYDVAMELKLLRRVGKVKRLKIIVVPIEMNKNEASKAVEKVIASLL